MEIKLSKAETDWLGWAMLEGDIISHEEGFELKNQTLTINVMSRKMQDKLHFQLYEKRFRRSRADTNVATQLYDRLYDLDLQQCDGCLGPGARRILSGKKGLYCESCAPTEAEVAV